MDIRDFVVLTLLAAGGEVQGKTKLQKLVYFIGVLTDQLDELGYRAHFYGPYSDDVAYAVGQLRSIGVLDQNETEWGYDQRGFEIKRSDYRLNEPGLKYAEMVKKQHRSEWEKINLAIERYNSSGDLDYMALSIAAKTYFLIGQGKGKSRSMGDLAALAPRFGWSVHLDQIRDAAGYLAKLGLVEVTDG